MGDFSLQMKKIDTSEGYSAEVSVDLSDYLNAYKNYKNIDDHKKHKGIVEYPEGSSKALEEAAAKDEYLKLRHQIFKVFDQAHGGLLNWGDMFELATEGASDAIKKAIEESPAFDVVSESFNEILKNSVDAAIDHHMRSMKGHFLLDTLEMKLKLTIDNTSQPDQISIRCEDNGKFDLKFLKRMASVDKQKDYVAQAAAIGAVSNKLVDHKLDQVMPLYVGGYGQAIARMLKSSFLNGSNVDVANQTDDTGKIIGAAITVRSSFERTLSPTSIPHAEPDFYNSKWLSPGNVANGVNNLHEKEDSGLRLDLDDISPVNTHRKNSKSANFSPTPSLFNGTAQSQKFAAIHEDYRNKIKKLKGGDSPEVHTDDLGVVMGKK